MTGSVFPEVPSHETEILFPVGNNYPETKFPFRRNFVFRTSERNGRRKMKVETSYQGYYTGSRQKGIYLPPGLVGMYPLTDHNTWDRSCIRNQASGGIHIL